MVVGPDGSEFANSVEKSGAAKTGDYIAEKMTTAIEDINETYQQLRNKQPPQANTQKLQGDEVVQIVTDSAPDARLQLKSCHWSFHLYHGHLAQPIRLMSC
jgi:hypothetical protein